MVKRRKDDPVKSKKHFDGCAERKRLLKEMVDDLKSNPCSDCGNGFPPYCMDFDHVSGEKKHIVSHMVAKGYSRQKVLDEIAKCALVCAVCHRIRTHNQGH